jgi:hypothetical protein
MFTNEKQEQDQALGVSRDEHPGFQASDVIGRRLYVDQTFTHVGHCHWSLVKEGYSERHSATYVPGRRHEEGMIVV